MNLRVSVITGVTLCVAVGLAVAKPAATHGKAFPAAALAVTAQALAGGLPAGSAPGALTTRLAPATHASQAQAGASTARGTRRQTADPVATASEPRGHAHGQRPAPHPARHGERGKARHGDHAGAGARTWSLP